jgi:hypothetical protein
LTSADQDTIKTDSIENTLPAQEPDGADRTRTERKTDPMASKTKKTEAIRKRKDKPNRDNLKKNRKRIEQNREILRELATKDSSG